MTQTNPDDALAPAPSVAKLVAGITDATQSDDIARINSLNVLVDLCRGPLSPDDVQRLKQLKSTLLSGHFQAVDSDNASELHAAKWQLLTELLHVDGVEFPASEQDLQTVLGSMVADRFMSSNVLAAMAQWLVQLISSNGPESPLCSGLLDVKMPVEEQEETYLELMKQMYVTLGGNSQTRQQLAATLEKLVTTKEQAKQVVKTGVLRSLLQIALENPDDGVLLQKFIVVGTRVAALVCFAAASELSGGTMGGGGLSVDEKLRVVCELVVVLMLSGVSLVFADGVRMLQLVIDNAPCRVLLPTVPDLRGALEKAHTLVRLKDSKLADEEYLKELCETQYSLLSPEIDEYERRHGSVVGLPSDDDTLRDDKSGEKALETATKYKTQGNAFFRRGNFPTARVFYRRAIAVLRAAQLQQETLLRSLSVDNLLAGCSIGASVQVCSRRGGDWQDAMVSDVEGNGAASQVEVLYDDGDQEDEWVPISRVRLRMNTALLTAFDDLAVDCSMNMGKAFSALGDHDQAVQCFSHALTIRGGKLIAALYSRGVANMARRDLTAAQQDLWDANQQCQAQQKSSTSGGTSKTNTRDAEQMRSLHKQIVAAYKKLQQMHANKKRLDKKVIKQMVKYLSTIPALQDE
ncbi:hypothetical protein PR003_g16310 [Phytophthora rubi]|uniref:Uncharacterized protein n=1 Tax=Phytophthora rubi TaxID=129364 RepID=A0A6A3KEG4_9STRA|nr:hypothetical protein PR002_g17147 [Phytophthora rubi]KAE9007505.1 hypothetical protein PR001_g16958 [Phytophthora rubi]KAE9326094.1 hypothetical protein PR003_g16310 [Phytophthora rubi]